MYHALFFLIQLRKPLIVAIASASVPGSTATFSAKTRLFCGAQEKTEAYVGEGLVSRDRVVIVEGATTIIRQRKN